MNFNQILLQTYESDITAFLIHQWLAVPGAVIFVLVAVYMFKKKD